MGRIHLTGGTIRDRSRGRKGFCWNSLFWGLGNGLISTSLVIYLAGTLTAGRMDKAQLGLAIGWIIAAPRLIGVLRLLVPALIDRWGSRKKVAFWGYLLSPLVLLLLPAGLPFLSRLARLHVNAALLAVGGIWAVYHLIEYFATVALWSWLGDFLSNRIRPAFLARRERFQITGQLAGNLAAGLWTFFFRDLYVNTPNAWRLYFPPAVCGILLLGTAVLPILMIPEVSSCRRASSVIFRPLLAPLRDRRFLIFVLFGCWIQTAGGLSQSVQSFTAMKTLALPLIISLALGSWTRLGQTALAGRAGNAIRRIGGRRVMIASLFLVSTGSLFYAAATPARSFWVWGAATVWIGWVGVNLAINDALYQMAPEENRSSYFAVYFTAVTLAFGLASMLGGHLFDLYRETMWNLPWTGGPVSYAVMVFVATACLRAAGVLFWIRKDH